MNSYALRTLAVVFLGLAIQATAVHGQTAPNSNGAERVKTQVDRLGSGEKAKVSVQKNDGTRMKGYISRASEETFDLTDAKTRQTTSIAYTDVSKIKKRGMSTGLKIAIIGGVAAAVVVVVIAVAAKDAFDDACFLGCP